MFTEEDIAKQLHLLQQAVHDFIAFYQQDAAFDTMVYTYWSVKVCWAFYLIRIFVT